MSKNEHHLEKGGSHEELSNQRNLNNPLPLPPRRMSRSSEEASGKGRDGGVGRENLNTTIQAEEDRERLQSHEFATLATTRMDSGEYENAIDLWTKAIERFSCNPSYFIMRSFCHFQLMKFDAALADADKAILIDPSDPSSFYAKGIALKGLRRLEEAEIAFNAATRIRPCDDYRNALREVRELALSELDFPRGVVENYATVYNSIQEAVDAAVGASARATAENGNFEGGDQDKGIPDEVMKRFSQRLTIAIEESEPPKLPGALRPVDLNALVPKVMVAPADSSERTLTSSSASSGFADNRFSEQHKPEPWVKDDDGKIAAYVNFDDLYEKIEEAKSRGLVSKDFVI